MAADELSEKLWHRYATVRKQEVTLAIHSFGIGCSEASAPHPINAIAGAGTGRASYGTEVRKRMRLSKHAMLKPSSH